MRLLLDMNLSPRLCAPLAAGGHQVEHWSEVGDPRAPDEEIMGWARQQGAVVVTHDLDFGAILAATGGNAPSVIQLRTQNLAPEQIAPRLIEALDQLEPALAAGALVVVDEARARARVLPLFADNRGEG
jgi:predicted nuclease of predicted toxin-antitoxin system